MLAVTAMFAITSAGHTTSQQVINGQINLDADIRVVVSGEADQADSTTITAVGLGNAVTVDVVDQHDVYSSQEFGGDVEADASVHARQIDGTSYTTSVAMGNTMDLLNDNGLDVNAVQLAEDGSSVTARSSYEVDSYGMVSVTTATAAANAIESIAYGGENEFDIYQDSGADVTADAEALSPNGGLGNSATVAAIASGNSTRFEGYYMAPDQAMDLDQNNRGDVAARSRMEAGGGAVVATAATQAAGNTAQVQNEMGEITMTGDQDNSGNVDAETDVVVGNFDIDFFAVSSDGVGNSLIISNIGQNVTTGVDQVNTGDVNATTNFTGGAGGQIYGAANAFGNAQTTYICSECPVDVGSNNTQVNGGDINAAINASMQSGSMLVGSASAVGNTATYTTVTPDG